VKDFVYLKLHKRYTQSNLINRKFNKQRLNFVKILEKINNLAYKLDIFNDWKIHSVIFINHLKSISHEDDFYQRKTTKSESMKDSRGFIKDIYKMKKILIKTSIKKKRSRKSKIQYKIKWLRWNDHHNQWINATDMKNVKNIMNEFERKLISRDENEQWSLSFTFSWQNNIDFISSNFTSLNQTHRSYSSFSRLILCSSYSQSFSIDSLLSKTISLYHRNNSRYCLIQLLKWRSSCIKTKKVWWAKNHNRKFKRQSRQHSLSSW
jgi:hypothetical protein